MSAHHHQEPGTLPNHHPDTKLLSSYLGLSFALFLGSLPNGIRLMQAEDELNRLRSRREEDSKANATILEIFDSRRRAWQQEEKRLLEKIDDFGEEIASLKAKIEAFERVKDDLKRQIEDLKRENEERYEKTTARVSELDLGVHDCFDGGGVDDWGPVFRQKDDGYGSNFLASTAAKPWPEKASLGQDVQYESMEPLYPMKQFTSRRESPWKVDGDSTEVSSKLRLLEQVLMNLERVGNDGLTKVPSHTRNPRQYQALVGKINDLCQRMNYNGDKSMLRMCEKYFLELMKVRRLDSKSQGFAFTKNFTNLVEDLKHKLNTVHNASREVKESSKLRLIMLTILKMGNT